MKIEVKILDDNGLVLAEHSADASQPSQWKSDPGKSLISRMPAQSDSSATGTYELFGITFQPHVRVERPNGWNPPPPSPLFGQVMGLTSSTLARDTPAAAPSPWGRISPISNNTKL